MSRTVDTPTPVKQIPVIASLDLMVKRSLELWGILRTLEERLAPVLTPSPKNTETGSVPGEPLDPPVSLVNYALKEETTRLETMQTLINGLMARLEI